MSMWEIDALLKDSINIIRASDITPIIKKNVIWSLENLPIHFEMDAGGFEKTEQDAHFEYETITPYALALVTVQEANKTKDRAIIYHWSAFLLNYGENYFPEIDTVENLKLKYLESIKTIFSEYDYADFAPMHNSLTIYSNGNKDWFSEAQNQLINWFANS